MFTFFKKYIASIFLLVSVIAGSVNIDILNKSISYYFNLQLILIYLFKISNPSLNFGKGVYLFLISIINDSLNGLFFGTSAILYFIVFAVAAFQSTIKLRSIFISEWFSFGLSLILAYLAYYALISFSGKDLIFLNIFINFSFTLIGYPLLWFIIPKSYLNNAIR
tara:strand:+ start:1513 stop:2007 length:495 start_codon:yes stop_codon:yes gene_type:complete